MYWLIYYHTGKLEGFRAKRFDDGEEMETWVKEMGNKITVVDVAESIEEPEKE